MNKTRQPIFNVVPGTLVLVVIILLAHLGLVWILDGLADGRAMSLAFSPGMVLALIEGKTLPYPVLTALSPLAHGFLHGGWLHLGINLLFLMAVGTGIERPFGKLVMYLTFFTGVLFGALAACLSYIALDSWVFVVGASGGISGLLGALVRMTPNRRLASVAGFILINLVIGIFQPAIPGTIAAVAWDVHIGGFLGGFLLFPLFARLTFLWRSRV